MDEVALVRRHIEGVLGLPVAEFEKLGVTAYNRHYRVEVDGDLRHLVVYHLPPELPIAGVRFEHAILRHLAERGYEEVPELLVVDGESLFRVDDRYFALTEWIEGCHSEQDLRFSRAQVRDAARALADFHRCTRGLDLRLDYFPEHVFVYTASHFLDDAPVLLGELAQRIADEDHFDNQAREHFEVFRPSATAFFRRFDRGCYNAVRALDETGVVHGDFRRINLVLNGERVVKVLDYNCCFNEVRLWDVAYSALSFGGKETVGPVTDLDQAAAFIRDYDAQSPLSSEEWDLLPDFLVFVVAKLMTAAMSSWWINERAETFERLLSGDAQAIVGRARGLAEA